MSERTIREEAAHIYCSTETRDRVRGLKRGGETYDQLLRRMADQYDPNTDRRVADKDG